MPTAPRKGARPFSSIYVRLGDKLGRELFQEVTSASSLRPHMTPAKLLAYVIATAVHALTLAFAGLGLWLVVSVRPRWVAIIAGLLCLAVAWVVRPRPWRPTRPGVSRADFPTLYDLADRVAADVGARPVRRLMLDPAFNASSGAIGWRQMTGMTLGVPLLVALAPEERVALLGHELGHGANGDPARTVFIGSAVSSLWNWYVVLYPIPPRPSAAWAVAWMAGAAHAIAYPFALALSNFVRLLAKALIHLLWRDGQRAEYLADELAARAGGTEGAVRMLEKLYLSVAYDEIVQSASLNQRGAIFDELRTKAGTVQGEWFTQVGSRDRARGFRLDATHPPTGYRIEFLRSRPAVRPSVLVSASDNARIDAELAKVEQRIEREILDRHRASLYR